MGPGLRGRYRVVGVGQSGFGMLPLLGFSKDLEACEKLRLLGWWRKVLVQETELRCCPSTWEKGHLPTGTRCEDPGLHLPILLKVEWSV